MKKLLETMSECITSTRMDWIALMVKGYGMDYPNMWKLLGYPSQQHYQFELTESEASLPTALTKNQPLS
ncbi:hypothetical protein L4D20_18555 [Vibrio kyushuensis]|uniref:hypothetical protein n=1 Tax=Vibrio TaxID=662 RepID=UPI003D1034A6